MKHLFNTVIILGWISILITSCAEPTETCFTYTPATVSPDSTVIFNAACSQNASFFTWDFGDSSADTTVTSLTITHQFLSKGQFVVTLYAERKDGVSAGKDKTVAQQTVVVQ